MCSAVSLPARAPVRHEYHFPNFIPLVSLTALTTMNRSLFLLLLAVLTARAENEALFCRGAGGFAPASDGTGGRHYSPSRDIDLFHLALDVTPDFKERTVRGQAQLRFKPILAPLRELKLDGVDLRVDSAT